MTDNAKENARTTQVPLWFKIVTAPAMALGLLFLYLGLRNADEWGDIDDEKSERAKRRSESIDDWSEVKNNDDWR